MNQHKVLITGSSGLIGSECVRFFLEKDDQVVGIDNNSRGEWFGPSGSVTNIGLQANDENYKFHYLDINNSKVAKIIKEFEPNLIIHCAAQPSHEKSSQLPKATFEVNAWGTMKLLERTRKYVPHATFAFTSTNKVYPYDGLRTPFGASKYAADIMVQEYGNYFGLKTVCFRCGCITGKAHKGVEAHGFLNYLAKCVKEGKPYTIYGFHGVQIRDNLHAIDVAKAVDLFHENPKPGAVYDLGGGAKNACTVNESIKAFEKRTGNKLKTKFGPARRGDFESWITDIGPFHKDYGWLPSVSLDEIFDELVSD